MPVDIDVIEEDLDLDSNVIVDEYIYQTIPQIVIASIRYGEVIEGILLQTENLIKQIEYPEFMYTNYSMLGEFIYDDCQCRLDRFVLNNKNLSPSQQYAYLLENRTVTLVHALKANQLHCLISETFVAIIEITLWSSAIQMGIKFHYTLMGFSE